LEEHRAALSAMDEFLQRDMLFHREIATIAGNPIFPAIVEALFNWASAYYQAIVRAPGAEHVTLAEHTRILDAIAAGDPAAAETAMRDHLLRASDLYQTVPQPTGS
jgi:DNA-binding FadR family transcriptional regulator